MAFKFYERRKSGTFTSTPLTYKTQWVAQGSSDRGFVQTIATSSTPSTYVTPSGDLLYRQNIQLEPESADVFYCTVSYATRKNEVGSFRLSFDTTGGMIHISHSLESIKRYTFLVAGTVSEDGSAPAGVIPSHEGAIGVHGKEIDGFDKFIPALKMSVNFKHPKAVIDLARIKALASITGAVNSDTFLSFQPGEVLFLGCTGDEGTDAEAAVQYQFAMSQNATNLSVGQMTGIEKKGHEVLWISYRDDVDESGYASRKPRFVYVERVYETVPFAPAFGFGG